MEDSCSSSSPPQSTEEGDLLSPSRHQCQSLINIVNEIAVIGDYRRTHRKDCMTLVRRIKLLMPLFEELKDMVSPPHEAFFLLCFFSGKGAAVCQNFASTLP